MERADPASTIQVINVIAVGCDHGVIALRNEHQSPSRTVSVSSSCRSRVYTR